MKSPGMSVLCGLLLLWVLTVSATAGVIYVKADAAGTSTGLSWTNAYTDLQAGLSAAKSGDEIWVAAGTYKPTSGKDRKKSFVMKEGVDLYGGFTGQETIHEARDWMENKTILSGDIGTSGTIKDNSSHIVMGANFAKLDGFTVSGAYAKISIGGEWNYLSSSGGGMFNDGVSPTIVDCTFIDNYAHFDAAGMFNLNGASPTVTNCTFINNQADNDGGGMLNDGYSSPSVTNCTFSGNLASYTGGGMYNGENSSPTVNNCTFQFNSAHELGGGGITNIDSSAIMINCTFTDNRADGGSYNYGGGMLNGNVRCSPTVINCTFKDNMAGNRGGGMYNHDCSPTIINCVFSSNRAVFEGGGAIYNYNLYFYTSPMIINSTFNDNKSFRYGGAMYNVKTYGECSPLIANCLFWGDTATTGTEVYTASGTPTFRHCNIAGSGGSGMGWNTALGSDGGGNIMVDPLFVDPTSPAGPDGAWRTSDDGLRLQPTSPCIDAGIAEGALTYDILKNPHLGVPDMGAYEYQEKITVLEPSGKDYRYPGGSLGHVLWRTCMPFAGTAVRLELYDDQGWAADLGYDWNPQGQGNHELYLPLAPERAVYRIRATSVFDPELWDESDQPFTITGGPLRVNEPKGSLTWESGSQEAVWWEANTLYAGSAVRLELWNRGSRVAVLGEDWAPDGESVRRVTVPSVQSRADYKVRAVSLWNQTYWAESAGLLRIENAALSGKNAVSPGCWTLYY